MRTKFKGMFLKRIFAVVIGCLLVAATVPFASASSAVSVSIDLTDENGEAVSSIYNIESFFVRIKLSGYNGIIGNAANGELDNVIAAFNLSLAIDTSKLNVVDITTPYANINNNGSLNVNAANGKASIVVETDSNCGLDYSITKNMLDSTGGLLAIVEMETKTLSEFSTSISLVEDTTNPSGLSLVKYNTYMTVHDTELSLSNVSKTISFMSAGYEQIDLTATTQGSGSITVNGYTNYANKKFYSGVPVELKAKPAQGYSFVYWTKNGNFLSYSATYTDTPSGDSDYVALFVSTSLITKINVVTKNCYIKDQFGVSVVKGTYYVGEALTVTAQPLTGYTVDGFFKNSQFFEYSGAMNMTVEAGMMLKAYAFQPGQGGANKHIYFLDSDSNVAYISEEYNVGESVDIDIDEAVRAVEINGGTFSNWYVGGRTVDPKKEPMVFCEGSMTAVAEYSQSGAKDRIYSVTVFGGSVTAATDGFKYGSRVTIAPETTTDFAGWQVVSGNPTLDGTIVSYSANYSFYVGSDIALSAVYGGPVTKTPLIAVTGINTSTQGGTDYVIFMTSRDFSGTQGYEYIESGVVFTYNAEYAHLLDPANISTEGGVFGGKSTSTAANGQYAAYIANGHGSIYLVAYLTYRDTATNQVITKYTDVVYRSCDAYEQTDIEEDFFPDD